MQARSALFDLYGDHIRLRGGVAPVAALVRLLAPLDIAAPAVRTAVSRMVRQGWLEPATTADGPGYALTDRATRRLDEAAVRIHRRPPAPWDGCWAITVTSHSANRTTRDRAHRALEYLGYRQLQADTWIAPRQAGEVESVVEAEGLTLTQFHGRLDGADTELVQRLYRPADLAADYRRWLETARVLVAEAGADPTPEVAFAARSRLVHEWRKFLFRDPGLPHELLPADWPGGEAATYFDTESERLLPAAAAYVDSCLKRRDR